MIRVIQGDRNKGKTHSKIHQAAEELDYLITFNRSITQAMARTMQDLSEGIFINVANLTLTRRDSYLDYIKSGIKQDMLTALRTAHLHSNALFPDHLISKAEEEICHHEDKHTASSSHKGSKHFYPYNQASRQQSDTDRKTGPPAWKQLKRRGQRFNRGKASCYSQRPAKGQKTF